MCIYVDNSTKRSSHNSILTCIWMPWKRQSLGEQYDKWWERSHNVYLSFWPWQWNYIFLIHSFDDCISIRCNHCPFSLKKAFCRSSLDDYKFLWWHCDSSSQFDETGKEISGTLTTTFTVTIDCNSVRKRLAWEEFLCRLSSLTVTSWLWWELFLRKNISSFLRLTKHMTAHLS